jgi:flagellar basal body rod protein FlgB
MNNKILAIFVGIIIFASIQPSEAKPRQKDQLLDRQTRQTIYNRICAAQQNDYTIKELWNYAKEMIRVNGNLVEIPVDYSPKLIAIINYDNTVSIVTESHKIINEVIKDNRCLPNSLRNQ